MITFLSARSSPLGVTRRNRFRPGLVDSVPSSLAAEVHLLGQRTARHQREQHRSVQLRSGQQRRLGRSPVGFRRYPGLVRGNPPRRRRPCCAPAPSPRPPLPRSANTQVRSPSCPRHLEPPTTRRQRRQPVSSRLHVPEDRRPGPSRRPQPTPATTTACASPQGKRVRPRRAGYGAPSLMSPMFTLPTRGVRASACHISRGHHAKSRDAR